MGFMAPEFVTIGEKYYKGNLKKYQLVEMYQKSDIWSLGLCFYFLFFVNESDF